MFVLGISALYHDSAAVLVDGGRVVAAGQEERFSRIRHDPSFPLRSIDYCLSEAGIQPSDLAAIVFYEKPFVKFFERILLTHLAEWPLSVSSFLRAIPEWLGEKLWLQYDLRKAGRFRVPVRYAWHHQSHAVSSFYCSPFEEAAVVTVDGVGEWATTTLGWGRGRDVGLSCELSFPHSLGLIYSAVTAYLGFKVNSAEYKVMGLAPYGEPIMVDKFEQLIDRRDDGSFRLRMEYFEYHRRLRMPSSRFERLFGHPARRSEGEPLTQFHKDCARSLQEFTNGIMLGLAREAYRLFPSRNLCLAGGVALNCVSNSYLLEHGPFERIFVQPAAGDAGGAVGAALLGARDLDPDFQRQPIDEVYWGPAFDDHACRQALEEQGFQPVRHESPERLIDYVAERLAEQDIVGWFQGRMEFGPRALGNRSILADPRRPENRDRVNLAIKFRESFRPFAPSVPEDSVHEWFEWDRPSRYMLFTARSRHPDRIPAVTHLDYSARLQTVDEKTNPLYYRLHRAFERLTECPVLINTSFNVRGEPIVRSPIEAIRVFLGTRMDLLVLGSYSIHKRDVSQDRLLPGFHHEFKPD